MTLSARTIGQRWKEMGLKGSKVMERTMTNGEIIQLVADEMAKDPCGCTGQNGLKQQIALNTGIHLKW
jgi:hypothetical protein